MSILKEKASNQKFELTRGCIKLMGEVTKYSDGSTSAYSYWVEIEGVVIPNSLGYAKTEEEFKKKSIASAARLLKSIVADAAPLVVGR